MRLRTFVVLLLIVLVTLATVGLWLLPLHATDPVTVVGARLPSERYGTSAVWDGSNAYVFGGSVSFFSFLDEIVQYDPVTDTATVMNATLPSERYYTTAAWDGTHAYVFGGDGGGAEIVRYDPTTDTVTVMSETLLSGFVFGSSAFFDGTHAYIFNQTEIWQYDPVLDKMMIMQAELPSSRPYASAVYTGNPGFLFGGSTFPRLDEIVRYDPSLDTALIPDRDRDGLNDEEEVARGTDPLYRDTDDDGASDGDEVRGGADPLNPDENDNFIPDGFEDWDDDGVHNAAEWYGGTDPMDPDTDDDGVGDEFHDPDGDGKGPIVEWKVRGDPNVAEPKTLEINLIEPASIQQVGDLMGEALCSFDLGLTFESWRKASAVGSTISLVGMPGTGICQARAWRDADGDGQPDSDEDWGYYGDFFDGAWVPDFPSKQASTRNIDITLEGVGQPRPTERLNLHSLFLDDRDSDGLADTVVMGFDRAVDDSTWDPSLVDIPFTAVPGAVILGGIAEDQPNDAVLSFELTNVEAPVDLFGEIALSAGALSDTFGLPIEAQSRFASLEPRRYITGAAFLGDGTVQIEFSRPISNQWNARRNLLRAGDIGIFDADTVITPQPDGSGILGPFPGGTAQQSECGSLIIPPDSFLGGDWHSDAFSLFDLAGIEQFIMPPIPFPEGCASMPMLPVADLMVEQTSSTGSPMLGQAVTHMTQITNDGPDGTGPFVLEIMLPESADVLSADATVGACDQVPTMGVLECQSDLADGAIGTYTLEVVYNDFGMQSYCTEVMGDFIDDTPLGQVCTELDVHGLEVTKEDALIPDPSVTNQTLRYLITIRNTGPNKVTGITLTDDFSGAPVSMRDAKPDPPRTCLLRQTVPGADCALGDLEPDEKVQVSILAVATGIGTVTNTATVEADGGIEVVAIETTTIVEPHNSVPGSNTKTYPERNPATNPRANGSSDGGVTAESPCSRNPTPSCPNMAQSVGDPIYLHSGELFLFEEDLRIPGRGFDLVFLRKYRSGVTFDGPLGHNWDHSYNRKLVEVTEANLATIPSSGLHALPAVGDVVRVDGFLRADLYQVQPDSSYTEPPGFYTLLAKEPDGSFTLRDYQGNADFFSADGRLIAQEDLNGNRLQFSYDGSDRLATVADTFGREVQFEYDANDRITGVTDFIGRTVTYTYDANGDLVEVTSPAVVGTPTGNDFPAGKTTRYEYSSGFDLVWLNHNILSVTAPNEVAAGGPPRLVFTYDEDLASPNLDRVLSQTLGGTNDTGVPAGGTITYQYDELEPSPLPGADDPLAQTTVTDRNGNVTEFQFSLLGNIESVRNFTNRDVRGSDPDFFETTHEYNQDGELTRIVFPEGNTVDYVYDEANPDRFQQGNLVAVMRLPDPGRGGDQTTINTTYTYDPLYNRTRTVVDPRGLDPGYVPPNGGITSPERYMTRYTFDYEEGCDFVAIGARTGRDPAEVQQLLNDAGMCLAPLGDVNGDGRTDQVNGNVVRTQSPSVNLLPDSKQAIVEGDTVQPIVELFEYNDFGQLTHYTDPEGNVDLYEYHPENDPDGDGQDPTPGVGDGPFGYLRQVIQDAVGTPLESDLNADGRVDDLDLRVVSKALGTAGPGGDINGDGTVNVTDVAILGADFGMNVALPTDIRTRYTYDPVGNIVREVNGRGIATDYVVNELNQIVQIIYSAAHDVFTPEPPEPLPLVDFQYLERIFYDFNDNIILLQVEDRGNTSGVDGNPISDFSRFGFTDPDPAFGTAFMDTVYTYDILDNQIQRVDEVTNGPSPEFLETRYRYDANENRVLTIQPEGNATTTVYDERDLVFQSARGATSPPASALLAGADPLDYDVRGGDPSTMTYHYDGNRNLIERVDAEDTDGSPDNDSDLGGFGDRTRYIYDGFDRLTSTVDSVGNQTVHQYHPAGNLVRTSLFGPVGGASPTSDGPDVLPMPVSDGGVIQMVDLVGDGLLEATEFLYDELSRQFQTDRVLFVNTIPTARTPDLSDGATDIGKGDLTPGDDQDIPGVSGLEIIGRVSTRTEYDRDSRVTCIVEDDADVFRYTYDGADRLIRTTGPEGNVIETAYDDNSNVIETRDVDVSQIPGVQDEIFVTSFFYDGLDRLQRTVDNLGQRTEYRYDSRDNLVAMADAQGPLTGTFIRPRVFRIGPRTDRLVNDFGNVTRYSYDGINRLVEQEAVLTVSGQGDGVNVGATIEGVKSGIPAADPSQGGGDGLITTRHQWDGNTLLQSVTDDNGNQTQYAYDNLDRVVTDTKGACVPPALADSCDPPTTTTYAYDQDSNVVVRTDEHGSVTQNEYDAINRVLQSDVVPGPGVVGTTLNTYEYDGLSRLTRATDDNEPADVNDDSQVLRAYDSLSRVIEESQQLGLGPLLGIFFSNSWRAENLPTEREYPNERIVTILYDDYDRLRVLDDGAPASPIAEYDYIGPSRVAQRVYPTNGTRQTHLTGTDDTGYDGLGRVVELRHLRADDSGIIGFQHEYDRRSNRTSENKLHDPVNSETYQYDSAYRLRQFDRPDPGSRAPLRGVWGLDGVGNWLQVDGETRMHSSFNELIETDDGGGGITTYQYDDNGNQINQGFLYEWDSRNRLRTVARKSDGAPIATYSYDALNRRISKDVSNSGPLDGVTRYYYDGWRVVEERDGADNLVQQYVYGLGLDEPLILDLNLDGGPDATDPGDQRLFYHQNALGSTFALTDTSGAIVEGYQYDAYGHQTVFEPGPNGVVDFGGDDLVTPGGNSALGNPYMFTGRRLDPETGLYYYRNRYYNAEQGRFTHRDPTGYRDGMGLYGYALNNPINVTDSLGLQGKSLARQQAEAALDSASETVEVALWQEGGEQLGKHVGSKVLVVGAKVAGVGVSVAFLMRDLYKVTEAHKGYLESRIGAQQQELDAATRANQLKHFRAQRAQQEKIDKIGQVRAAREEAFRRQNQGDPEATMASQRKQQERNAKACSIFFGGGSSTSGWTFPTGPRQTVALDSWIDSPDLDGPKMMHGMPQSPDLDIDLPRINRLRGTPEQEAAARIRQANREFTPRIMDPNGNLVLPPA